MNIAVAALPGRRLLHFDHIRGLYNGFGYILALSLILDLWWTTQATLPQLLAGNTSAFIHDLRFDAWWGLIAMIPGLTLLPIVVNLAPRAGLPRLAWLLAVTIPMGWWCLWVDGVHFGVRFGWDWSSLGIAVEYLLTPGMVVAVCAYHSDTREAGDALMRARIRRTTLDAELMQAQLQLLRAQIEPHFLFNTLSVVRALSRSDRAATVAMLDNIIRYFEAALPRLRESEVPLAQELELVEAYLAIYRARMGMRLSYEMDAAGRACAGEGPVDDAADARGERSETRSGPRRGGRSASASAASCERDVICCSRWRIPAVVLTCATDMASGWRTSVSGC